MCLFVCVLRIREEIPLLGEEESYISDQDVGRGGRTRTEFVIMALIIGADWWDCILNMSLCIIARADRGVTCYEHGGRSCCWSVSGDLE